MNYRVKCAIERIKIASHIAERHNQILKVCFSGGKDSQVLLDLVKKSGVAYMAFYNVTTNDHPYNVRFIREKYKDVKFIHPELNFYDLCIKKKMLPTMKARFCCKYLKEDFGDGIKLLGVRREESTKRQKYRIIEREKNKKTLRVYPIIDWYEFEIWDYIEKNNLPINPLYDLGKRVGCMVCPFAPAKQIEQRFIEFPQLRNKMLYVVKKLRADGFCRDYAEKSDDEILHWWMSKKNIKDYFQPQFPFEK